MARSRQVARMSGSKRTAEGAIVTRNGRSTRRGKKKAWFYKPTPVITGLGGNDYGFPDKLRTRIRYCETVQTVLTAGAITNYVFRMNSLNDPNFTGVGHQPRYFDQFCSGNGPYNQYRVLGSKIKVTFTPVTDNTAGVVNTAPVLCAIYNQPNSTTAATTDFDIMELSNCNWTVLQNKPGGNNVKTLTNTFSINKDLGTSRWDDTNSAFYNSNPADAYYANILMYDQNFAPNVRIYVEIDYNVEFFDLFDPPRS